MGFADLFRPKWKHSKPAVRGVRRPGLPQPPTAPRAFAAEDDAAWPEADGDCMLQRLALLVGPSSSCLRHMRELLGEAPPAEAPRLRESQTGRPVGFCCSAAPSQASLGTGPLVYI